MATGKEQDFDYGLRNLAATTENAPTQIVSQAVDGTFQVTPISEIEITDNKQNNLNYDGTATKYPTVDAVSSIVREVAKAATKTGLLSKNDTFNLIALTNTTLRIAAVDAVMFWNELFTITIPPPDAIKSLPQKDYNLDQLITATGGNVNLNPLTTDGKYIRYLGYDKNGNVYSSTSNFSGNNDIFQLGFVTVLKTGSTVEFLDGTAGPRNVLSQPNIASNTDFDKVTSTTTNVTIARKSNASISSSTGTITGLSVNWKSAQNPSNGNPIDVYNVTAQATAAFTVIDPTFLTSTAAITTHTLFTELDGGIAINESFYNTTTGLRGTMTNGSAAVARILIGVRGGIFWQMGEFASTACYADLATAKSNIYSHIFSEAIVPPGVAYEIGRVAFTKGFTVTNNDTQFYLVGTGQSGSGGSSTIPPVSDATTATKGIIKLAGDFDATSTADLPVIKDASASSRGVVTTGSQTFAGAKSFNGLVNLASSGSGLNFTANQSYTANPNPFIVSKSGLLTIYGSASSTPSSKGGISFDQVNVTGAVDRVVTFQDTNGTMALVGKIGKTRKDVTGTTYTLLSSDFDKILYFTNASGCTVTVPSGLTINQEYECIQYAAAQVSFVTSGTTLRYQDYAIATTYAQYSRVLLSYLDTETYSLFGDLAMI